MAKVVQIKLPHNFVHYVHLRYLPLLVLFNFAQFDLLTYCSRIFYIFIIPRVDFVIIIVILSTNENKFIIKRIGNFVRLLLLPWYQSRSFVIDFTFTIHTYHMMNHFRVMGTIMWWVVTKVTSYNDGNKKIIQVFFL